VEAVRDEERAEGGAPGDVARRREGAQRGAVVRVLARDEVGAGRLAGPEEVLDGQLEGSFYRFRALGWERLGW
jgi:hypothetical protein